MVFVGLFIILSYGLGNVSAASTIYVNGSSGNDHWNGLNSTWISGTLNGPKATIENATATINTDGTVYIASGTYNESQIMLTRNMTIIGENRENTIINGQKSGADIFETVPGIDVTITGLTFTNSLAIGGALNNEHGVMTVNNCTFTNNFAQLGGAITNEQGGILNINNCTFTNNSGGQGAINNAGGTLIVDNSIFETSYSDAYGGAINNEGVLIIGRCTFKNNIAEYCGGAIFNGNTMIVTTSNFINNSATEYGGAIYNGNTATVKFNRFIGNNVTDIFNDGGIINAEDNWWGTNFDGTNPLNVGRVNFNVKSWIVLTIKAIPSSIDVGDISNIEVDMLHDNHNNIVNSFPYSENANFQTDLGTIDDGWFSNGMALSILNSNNSGNATITSSVDNQIVSTQVQINTQESTNPLNENSTTKKSYTDTNTVLNAETNKIPMQHTGVPIAGLLFGILSILGGTIISRRK